MRGWRALLMITWSAWVTEYSRQAYIRGKNNADQVTNNKARHPRIHWNTAQQFCGMRVWRNSGRKTSVKIGEVLLLPNIIPFSVTSGRLHMETAPGGKS
jgi:hypothetical protein